MKKKRAPIVKDEIDQEMILMVMGVVWGGIVFLLLLHFAETLLTIVFSVLVIVAIFVGTHVAFNILWFRYHKSTKFFDEADNDAHNSNA